MLNLSAAAADHDEAGACPVWVSRCPTIMVLCMVRRAARIVAKPVPRAVHILAGAWLARGNYRALEYRLYRTRHRITNRAQFSRSFNYVTQYRCWIVMKTDPPT